MLRFKDYHFSIFIFGEILFAFNQLARCFKSAFTSLLSFLIELLRHKRLVHQQSGKLCKVLLLDLGHLYIVRIEGVPEQILEGHHNLKQQDQIHIHL